MIVIVVVVWGRNYNKCTSISIYRKRISRDREINFIISLNFHMNAFKMRRQNAFLCQPNTHTNLIEKKVSKIQFNVRHHIEREKAFYKIFQTNQKEK